MRIADSLSGYLRGQDVALPKSLSPEEAASQIVSIHYQSGGATFNLRFGDLLGQSLYAVSLYPERTVILRGREIPPEIVEAFIQANATLLSDPRVSVGTWYNSEENQTYIDLTAVVPGKRDAIRLATAYDQEAIYDLRRERVIETGGMGAGTADMPPIDSRLPDLAHSLDLEISDESAR